MAVAPSAIAATDSPPRMGASPPVVEGGLDTFTLLRRWTDWMDVSGRFALSTRTQYRRQVIRFLADTLIPLEQLTEDDVVAYLAALPAKGGMRGQTIRALGSVCKFGQRRGLLETNAIAWLTPPREKYGDAPYLTDADLTLCLEAAERLDPRARPTLELMFATGARVGSVCGVLPEDVNLTKRTIHFRVAKGDWPYTNPLGTRGYAAARQLLDLIDYIAPRGPRERRPTLVGVAPVVVQRWAKLAGELAGVKLWCHLLRHSFCERISNNPKIPEIVVVELMNWRDSSQMRRYTPGRDPLKREAVEV